jgi:hypothetical protein
MLDSRNRKCVVCGKLVPENTNYIYIGGWNVTFTNVLYFHKECFQSVAGEEYVRLLDIKHVEK